MGGKFTKFFKCTVDRAGWEATSRELECLSQTTWRDDKNLNSLSKIQSSDVAGDIPKRWLYI